MTEPIHIVTVNIAREHAIAALSALGAGGIVWLLDGPSRLAQSAHEVWIEDGLLTAAGTDEDVVILKLSDSALNALAALRAIKMERCGISGHSGSPVTVASTGEGETGEDVKSSSSATPPPAEAHAQ